MNNLIFIRNDDVRNKLDDSLTKITDIFINNQIPIAHAIEPANVSKDVINWLLNLKNSNPALIEIIQHGFNHKLNYKKTIGGKLKKGEFGGDRSYNEQYDDIKKGKELMNAYFAEKWFPAFTFPYGARNEAAIKAVSDCGYKVINGSMGVSFNQLLLYKVGQLLKKEMLFDRKISWNLKYKPGTNIFQIDTSISLIKKFHDENESADFFTIDELKNKTLKFLEKKKNVGFVLHHRYHNNYEKIKLVEDFVMWLKTLQNIEFTKMEDIYIRFSNR